MPKIKTNRAVAKRFKKTAKGGLKSAHAFTSHRFHGKTKKQRRHLRGTHVVSATNTKKYLKLLK
ncbi:50S ribosomal protein L35 [Nicoliella spurrieriana]|uniref:Large ribosomal subunit protein bL35 n=1 Tax=Nicoliella spurrieriana TaxID=2925830 RepID=A0A976RSA2_9LACO|nr:50S ribosomal protein L35 [Nicoliella spurrieriana]UQS86706.1 50S ribosomal protein L35 [Nicoliella spurrieriana]